MKHEDFSLSVVAGTLVVILLCCTLMGCRSSHQVVEETRTEAAFSHTDSTGIDSVFMETGRTVTTSDSISAAATDSGYIEIARDSAGRIARVDWRCAALFKGVVLSDVKADQWLFGLEAVRSSRTSGKVDSVNEKTEEAAQVVDTSIPLENIMGAALIGVLILLLAGVVISDSVWPWIKRKLSR